MDKPNSQRRNPAPSNVIGLAVHNAQARERWRPPMKYMLLIYADETGFQRRTQQQASEAMAAYNAYTEALKKADVWVGSSRLRPVGEATTVHLTNGKTNVLNGPYAETKEQLGGYYMIDVPD